MNRAETCEFWEPADPKPCGRAGRRLLLRTDIGGLCVRYLCAEHSDFEEAPEADLERPLSLRDRATLKESGIAWTAARGGA